MEQPSWTTGPDRKGFWIYLAVALIVPPAALWTRRDWRGRRQVPRRGGAIVAINHIGYADVFFVCRFIFAAGRVPRFLAKAELFDLRPWGRVVAGAEQIRVYRGGPGASGALRDAVAALRRGALVVVYPEGTVTKDPDLWPMRAKTGIGRLALETGAPIVPVAQWGAHELLDENRRPRFTHRPLVQFLAGPPLDMTPWAGAEGPEAAREVTDAAMDRVRAQLGELRGEAPPDGTWDPSLDRRVGTEEREPSAGRWETP